MSDKPTGEQRLASNPGQSVWVSASAGTGKTRVLVNRLLRLLLAGNAPEKLLCITFTKAAAAEVLQRVQEIVLDWSITDHGKLFARLDTLLERKPLPAEITRARRLLPVILQSPGGMKIMTIHAFCQSVLMRFPLEANVSPGFAIADDSQAQALLNEAKYRLLDETTEFSHPDLFAHLTRFFDRVEENSQNGLIQNILGKRFRLNAFTERHGRDEGAVTAHICRLLDIAPGDLVGDRDAGFVKTIDVEQLGQVASELRSGSGKTPGKIADQIVQWLANGRRLDDYTAIFLTKKNTLDAYIAKGFKGVSDMANAWLHDEASRVFAHIGLGNKIDLALDTVALLQISLAIVGNYQALKRLHAVLDYEDQILLTARLLKDPQDAQWVHYKLDGGIDHILVDEAQDTSPAQWAIIEGISADFFAGSGRRDVGERSLFVVGDEKQSIFSFQNADPVAFSNARHFFAAKAHANKVPWQDVALIDNFRSAPLILQLTDAVFSDPALTAAISKDERHIRHQAFHDTRAGSVELWPLVPQPDKDNTAPNAVPAIILANTIAAEVARILTDDPSLQPGDIMILVRKRHPLVGPLTKAFKERSIPVTSADRLVLRDQLAVQDCLIAIQSCLHHEDDYALACFLKSPFIGLNETQLYELAVERTGTLWQRLMVSGHRHILDYVERLTADASTMLPGHFIHALLSQPCPNDLRSGRHGLVKRLGFDADDILDELLLTAYGFEDNRNATPQAFVTWMHNNEAVIKRAGGDADKSRVQIMTVHAAKGLQAKIVFLADAHSKPESYKSLREVIWQEKPADGFLWGMGDAKDNDIFATEKRRHVDLQFSEYYRLLYVALTRPEQRLIVCGWQGKTNTARDYPSWYEAVAVALSRLKNNDAYNLSEMTLFRQQGLRLQQTGAATEKPDDKPVADKNKTIPAHLLVRPADVEKRLRPLRPSRSSESEQPVLSPLQPPRNDAYKRGQILHLLFRLVPDYPVDEQEESLHNLLIHHVADESEREQMATEVMAVIRDKKFAHLFTVNAKAEVPVVGEIVVGGETFAVSGQIDRLLIEPDRILIVDYKTNRPPVLDADKISGGYKHQLATYKALLEKIYPGRPVETAILWTSIPYLLPLSL